MTRTITTLEELEALPIGAVILDKMGDAGLIDDGYGGKIVQYAESGGLSLTRAAKHYLPATVLHDPSAPVVPAPDPDDRSEWEAVMDVIDQCTDEDPQPGMLVLTDAGDLADAILAAGFRRLTVTPEMIEAGAKVVYDDYTSEYSYAPWDLADRTPFMDQARAVLEAAILAATPNGGRVVPAQSHVRGVGL